jgi:branched-chain amino acid transport system substrate-binding protein
MIMTRRIFWVGLAMAMVTMIFAGVTAAEDTVTIGIVCELSGSGAPAGMRWHRGVLMAMEEINEAGGLLGKKIAPFSLDTKTEPPVSVAAMKKAIERKPFVIMGTVYSSSTVVNMHVLQKAGIPQITGSGAPAVTQQGNPNIFRTEFNTALSMRKVAVWLTDVLKVEKLAIIYTSDAMGKGLRDALVKLVEPKGVEIVADMASEAGQVDFTGEFARVKSSGADTFFVYLHEEECGRLMSQAKDMGIDKITRIVGDGTLITEDAIRLAGDAANGVEAHVALSPVAEPLRPLAAKYLEKYGEVADHNFLKAYIGMQMVKAVVDEIGSFDQQKFRDFLHNRTLCVKEHPGILMDIHIDENGDVSKNSFIITVKDRKHVISSVLPPLNPAFFDKCKP